MMCQTGCAFHIRRARQSPRRARWRRFDNSMRISDPIWAIYIPIESVYAVDSFYVKNSSNSSHFLAYIPLICSKNEIKCYFK